MADMRTLSNIRNLRAALREATLEQAEALLEKVTLAVNEKREAVQAEELAQAKKLEELMKQKAALEEAGISLEEFVAFSGGIDVIKAKRQARQPRQSRAPRPAKYKYIDENGEVKTWTGQGRTPRVIQAALNEGKTLDSFAI